MSKKRDGEESIFHAANRERRIIAAEMHDSACQSLAALSLRVGAAIRRGRSGKRITLSELETIGNQLGTALDQCRSLMDFDVIESKPNCLPERMRQFIRLFGSRVECRLLIDSEMHFSSSEIPHFYYRAVREILASCARHRSPLRLEIVLRQTAAEFSLEIKCKGLSAKAWHNLVTGDNFLPRMCRALDGLWKVDRSILRCIFVRCNVTKP